MPKYKNIIAKPVMNINSFNILVCEYIPKFKHNKFIKIYGITFKRFCRLIGKDRKYLKEKNIGSNTIKTIMSFDRFITDNNIPIDEIDTWQCGIKNDKIKLLDYGANLSIIEKYY